MPVTGADGMRGSALESFEASARRLPAQVDVSRCTKRITSRGDVRRVSQDVDVLGALRWGAPLAHNASSYCDDASVIVGVWSPAGAGVAFAMWARKEDGEVGEGMSSSRLGRSNGGRTKCCGCALSTAAKLEERWHAVSSRRVTLSVSVTAHSTCSRLSAT